MYISLPFDSLSGLEIIYWHGALRAHGYSYLYGTLAVMVTFTLDDYPFVPV
jgi:hypothetical protein